MLKVVTCGSSALGWDRYNHPLLSFSVEGETRDRCRWRWRQRVVIQITMLHLNGPARLANYISTERRVHLAAISCIQYSDCCKKHRPRNDIMIENIIEVLKQKSQQFKTVRLGPCESLQFCARHSCASRGMPLLRGACVEQLCMYFPFITNSSCQTAFTDFHQQGPLVYHPPTTTDSQPFQTPRPRCPLISLK